MLRALYWAGEWIELGGPGLTGNAYAAFPSRATFSKHFPYSDNFSHNQTSVGRNEKQDIAIMNTDLGRDRRPEL